MKKSQFASPIILILLIVSYFSIYSMISHIDSKMLEAKTYSLSIMNDIKDIDKLDLEWRASLTETAMNLMSYLNSSEDINAELHNLNASIDFSMEPLIMEYNKTYEINGNAKSVSGTVEVLYPFNEFVSIEADIRECAKTQTVEYCALEYDEAELSGTIIYLSDSNYPLTLAYSHMFFIE